MKPIYSFLFFLFLILSCAGKKQTTDSSAVKEDCVAKTNESCICIQLFDPVCGCDGRTYSNKCYAECVGITYQPGECEKDKSSK